jgi:hypothetical protein
MPITSASHHGTAGTGPEVATKAGMANPKTSGTPHPGDRTFVGQPKPRDPAEIGLGSVVLAHEGPDEGWWEAEVIGINGRVFSLRWFVATSGPVPAVPDAMASASAAPLFLSALNAVEVVVLI